jgi:hypothetical protein
MSEGSDAPEPIRMYALTVSFPPDTHIWRTVRGAEIRGGWRWNWSSCSATDLSVAPLARNQAIHAGHTPEMPLGSQGLRGRDRRGQGEGRASTVTGRQSWSPPQGSRRAPEWRLRLFRPRCPGRPRSRCARSAEDGRDAGVGRLLGVQPGLRGLAIETVAGSRARRPTISAAIALPLSSVPSAPVARKFLTRGSQIRTRQRISSIA